MPPPTVAAHSLTHLVEQLGYVAGAAGSFGVLAYAGRRTWQTLRSIVRFTDAANEIIKWFAPNGGTSVPESLERIDKNIRVNARNIETVYTTILSLHDLDSHDLPLLETLEQPSGDE